MLTRQFFNNFKLGPYFDLALSQTVSLSADSPSAGTSASTATVKYLTKSDGVVLAMPTTLGWNRKTEFFVNETKREFEI
jgi:hypothetical protein